MKILAVVIVIAFGVAGWYDYRGDHQAQSFCAKVPVGSDVSALLAAEKAGNVSHYVVRETGAYAYAFRGFIFSSGVCEYSIANGKITAKRFYHYILK